MTLTVLDMWIGYSKCNILEGEYVDLIANPEQFTGYSGIPANRIWSVIYNENCFGISELDLKTQPGVNPAPVTVDSLVKDSLDENEQCLEKRVYYKIVSGEYCFFILS